MGRLDERVALVTGGGRGIGRAIALSLAADGADVAVSSRTKSELDAVVTEIEALGRRGWAVPCDALDGPATKRAVDEVATQRGRLDCLFCVAGGLIGEIPQLLPLSHDDELFEQNLFLNLTSSYYAARAALPHMVAQDWGRIVFIGSGYAKTGGGLMAYSAGKHGLIGMMRSMVWQIPKTITVNTLCPGWTNTKLVDWDRLGDAYGTDAAAAKKMAEMENVQQRILEPEELGPMAALLAADEAAGITGQVISVDGGYKV